MHVTCVTESVVTRATTGEAVLHSGYVTPETGGTRFRAADARRCVTFAGRCKDCKQKYGRLHRVKSLFLD